MWNGSVPHISLYLFLLILNTVQQVSSIVHAQSPCDYPTPYSDSFEIFCQNRYHGANYLCDSSGLLSRTEVELLDVLFSSLNFTTAFCRPHCASNKIHVGIVMVDVAALHSLSTCTPYLESSSSITSSSHQLPLIASSLEFARLLNQHWDDAAPADLLLLLIRAWHPSHLHRPVLVPYFTRRLSHLSRHSVGVYLSPRTSFLEALKNGLKQASIVIKRKVTRTNSILRQSTIPQWVIYSTIGLVILVLLSIKIANWVASKMNQAKKPKWCISSYKSNSRFRASFSRGLVRDQPQRKSTMMFRSFNKRNGIPPAQRI